MLLFVCPLCCKIEEEERPPPKQLEMTYQGMVNDTSASQINTQDVNLNMQRDTNNMV